MTCGDPKCLCDGSCKNPKCSYCSGTGQRKQPPTDPKMIGCCLVTCSFCEGTGISTWTMKKALPLHPGINLDLES